MHQPSTFWRREVMEKVGLLREDNEYPLDFDYWARIAEYFDFQAVGETLSCATYHPAAKTGDDYRRYHQELRRNAARYWGSPLRPAYWQLKASMFLCLVVRPLLGKWALSARFARLRRDLERIVPRGCSLILADEQKCGFADNLSDRSCVPFLERDGLYWGRPEDGRHAVRELERLRSEGADFFAVAQPALWWLDYYVELTEHLRARFPCVLKNRRLVVFDLRTP
jgi:hypothetical protein